MKLLAALALLGLAACGPIHTASTSSTSSAPRTASPAPTASAAVKETLLAVSLGQPCPTVCAKTIAIVGLDGQVRATATFTPPPPPSVGCEGGFIVSPVQVAAGAVFYLDTDGVVSRFDATGRTRAVAKFPILTSQQLTWFAVSPDGTRIMATIVAWPPLVSPPIPPSQGCPVHVAGDVREELDLATVDGATTTIWTKTLFGGVKTAPAPLLAMAGWDGIGPVATTDTRVAYIGFVDGTVWLGPASHLDSHGQPQSPIGGPDCDPSFGDLADGNLICYDHKQPTVRDVGGQILWKLRPLDPGDNFTYGYIALSPDASRVAFVLNSNCCYTFDSSVMRSRDGVRIGLGTEFAPQGWLDNETIVGQKGSVRPPCSGCQPAFVPDTLALVRIASPTTIVSLGMAGTFLGLVQG